MSAEDRETLIVSGSVSPTGIQLSSRGGNATDNRARRKSPGSLYANVASVPDLIQQSPLIDAASRCCESSREYGAFFHPLHSAAPLSGDIKVYR